MAKNSKQKAVEQAQTTDQAANSVNPPNLVPNPPGPIQLTIADLQLVSNIIDLASRRGAFQAGELTQVGSAFDKLNSFIQYINAQQNPQDETANKEAATAVAESQA